MFGLTGVSVDLKALTVSAFAASAFFGIGGSIIGGETGGNSNPYHLPPYARRLPDALSFQIVLIHSALRHPSNRLPDNDAGKR